MADCKPDGRDDDAGVTAVVGTVLVLAITVTGIGVALFMGTPVVQRLQDQAALDSVVGGFEAARHSSNALSVEGSSRTSTLSLPAGVVEFGKGSHFLVTSTLDDDCVFQVTNWADWGQAAANAVTVSAPGCTVHSLDVYDVRPGERRWLGETGSVAAPFVLPTGQAGTDPSVRFEEGRDYLFQLNSSASSAVPPTAEAWLLHADRLSWARGGTEAILEGGAVFARDHGAIYRVSGPRVDEGSGDTFALSLPTFQESSFAGSLPSGDHALFQKLVARELRNTWSASYRVDIAIHGDLAEAWCNTFLQRNAGANLREGQYLGTCTAAADGVRTVRFQRDGPDADTLYDDPFPFQFGQPILHAALQI